jgi:hypothetical protein
MRLRKYDPRLKKRLKNRNNQGEILIRESRIKNESRKKIPNNPPTNQTQDYIPSPKISRIK